MTSSLPQRNASFQQQSPNLVDDRSATHYPALAHPMQGLQIQLVIRLDRHKTHRRPRDGLSDRLRIDVVALVRLYVRLHILRRDQPHLMTLLPQRPAKKMGASARFHTNQLNLHVRGEAEQLRSREMLPHHYLPALVHAYDMKARLT